MVQSSQIDKKEKGLKKTSKKHFFNNKLAETKETIIQTYDVPFVNQMVHKNIDIPHPPRLSLTRQKPHQQGEGYQRHGLIFDANVYMTKMVSGVSRACH